MFTKEGKPHTYAVLVERDVMDLSSLLDIWNDSVLSQRL